MPPTGGAATSKTPTPATTSRSSHGVRDEQRHTPVTLGTAVGRALCVVRGMKEFSMPAEMLAKMACSRWVVMEFLLTRLEVEARHGPRSYRRHPRQQKL